MEHYPTSKEIKLWTASAIDIFQSIMPPINTPYPCVHIATAQTFPKMRAELLAQTGCKHTEEPKPPLWNTYSEIKDMRS